MCLRWGLARVVRIVAGQEMRGLVSWQNYLDWRESESGLSHFLFILNLSLTSNSLRIPPDALPDISVPTHNPCALAAN